MGRGRGVQGARRGTANTLSRYRALSLRPVLRTVSAGIAALGIGFILGLHVEALASSAFGGIYPASLDRQAPAASQIPTSPRVRLASMESEAVSESDLEDEELRSGWGSSRLTGAPLNRFFFDPRVPSFEERFGGAAGFDERFGVVIAPGSQPGAETKEPLDRIVLSPPDPGERTRVRGAAGQSPSGAAPTSSLRAGTPKKRLASLETPNDSSSTSDADAHTAIYDVTGRTVYMPNGRRLEAHSGLGSYMDDVRYVSAKARGPTPPNVYALSMREQLFHGVRAIRLNPVGNGNMFGRGGILAHPYMLGPNGQSNGCVSFSDYPAFLNAFLSGEIDRLVVVEHLDSPPDPKTGSGWLAESIKAFFRRS